MPAIPHSLTGKNGRPPIRKLLLGQPLKQTVYPDSLANPGSIAWFGEFAARYQQQAT